MITATEAWLRGLLDDYYAALAAGDPGRLPLAADVRFTENGQPIAIGTGLWATANDPLGGRPGSAGRGSTSGLVLAVTGQASGPEGTTGHVAGWGMVAEGGTGDPPGPAGRAGADALLGVRLKTTGQTISEIETLVVRRPPFGRDSYPDSLREPSEPMLEVIDPAERGTPEDLIKAANGYFDGVARDDAGLIPAADDCVRIENGLQTVLNADGAGFPPDLADSEGLRLGVRAQIDTMAFRYIEDIRDRRFPVIDTERGLVLAMCFFDHPGQLRGADFDSPIRTPNSMMIWELFKVRSGLIRRIEAIGAAFPYGMRWTW